MSEGYGVDILEALKIFCVILVIVGFFGLIWGIINQQEYEEKNKQHYDLTLSNGNEINYCQWQLSRPCGDDWKCGSRTYSCITNYKKVKSK